MYNLPHFKATNETEVLTFMKQHPFAMLIGNAENKAVATQIPLLFEERNGKLFGYEFKFAEPTRKIKAPKAWSENYPAATFKVIHKNNFEEFILKK